MTADATSPIEVEWRRLVELAAHKTDLLERAAALLMAVNRVDKAIKRELLRTHPDEKHLLKADFSVRVELVASGLFPAGSGFTDAARLAKFDTERLKLAWDARKRIVHEATLPALGTCKEYLPALAMAESTLLRLQLDVGATVAADLESASVGVPARVHGPRSLDYKAISTVVETYAQSDREEQQAIALVLAAAAVEVMLLPRLRELVQRKVLQKIPGGWQPKFAVARVLDWFDGIPQDVLDRALDARNRFAHGNFVPTKETVLSAVPTLLDAAHAVEMARIPEDAYERLGALPFEAEVRKTRAVESEAAEARRNREAETRQGHRKAESEARAAYARAQERAYRIQRQLPNPRNPESIRRAAASPESEVRWAALHASGELLAREIGILIGAVAVGTAGFSHLQNVLREAIARKLVDPAMLPKGLDDAVLAHSSLAYPGGETLGSHVDILLSAAQQVRMRREALDQYETASYQQQQRCAASLEGIAQRRLGYRAPCDSRDSLGCSNVATTIFFALVAGFGGCVHGCGNGGASVAVGEAILSGLGVAIMTVAVLLIHAGVMRRRHALARNRDLRAAWYAYSENAEKEPVPCPTQAEEARINVIRTHVRQAWAQWAQQHPDINIVLSEQGASERAAFSRRVATVVGTALLAIVLLGLAVSKLFGPTDVRAPAATSQPAPAHAPNPAVVAQPDPVLTTATVRTSDGRLPARPLPASSAEVGGGLPRLEKACEPCSTQEDFDVAWKKRSKCCPGAKCLPDSGCENGRVCCRIPDGQLCADAHRCAPGDRVR